MFGCGPAYRAAAGLLGVFISCLDFPPPFLSLLLLCGSRQQPQLLNRDSCVLCDWLKALFFCFFLERIEPPRGELRVWSVVRFRGPRTRSRDRWRLRCDSLNFLLPSRVPNMCRQINAVHTHAHAHTHTWQRAREAGSSAPPKRAIDSVRKLNRLATTIPRVRSCPPSAIFFPFLTLTNLPSPR